jgi:Protein of unknown function (DUF4011)
MEARVLARIEQWRSQLLDLTKRNRLINCPMARSGAIVIEYPDPTDVWGRLLTKGHRYATESG